MDVNRPQASHRRTDGDAVMASSDSGVLKTRFFPNCCCKRLSILDALVVVDVETEQKDTRVPFHLLCDSSRRGIDVPQQAAALFA